MNSNETKRVPKWGILATATIVILLLLGGAIYAQGFGRGQGRGPGMGMGRGMGMGPGMGPAQGPGGMMGAGMLMMDPNVRDLMAKIRIVEGINKLDLSADQVEALLGLARECRDIRDQHFGDLHGRILESLRDQLHEALAGHETDPDLVRGIMEDFRAQHEPGEMRELMERIINRALEILTDEQREMVMNEMGPGPEMIRERVEEWRAGEPDRDRPGWRWFQGLSDEERGQVRERVGERVGQMREGGAKMKIMMFLMAPQSIEAMELWLEAH